MMITAQTFLTNGVHARTLIRRAIASILKNSTAAGSNVFASRFAQVAEKETPIIVVHLGDERIEQPSNARRFQRVADLNIRAVVSSDVRVGEDTRSVYDRLQGEAESLSMQIEKLLDESNLSESFQALQCLVATLDLGGLRIDFGQDTARPRVEIEMMYVMTYHTQNNVDPSELADFLRFFGSVDIAPSDEQIDIVAHNEYPAT